MKIINQTRDHLLADQAYIARGFWARAKGLLGRKNFFQGQALVIPRCQAIHMFFMRFAIDVVFLNKEHVVVGISKNIKPFCLSPFFFKADCALELPVGTVAQTQTQLGDRILIEQDKEICSAETQG